jgi:hypothetical protein
LTEYFSNKAKNPADFQQQLRNKIECSSTFMISPIEMNERFKLLNQTQNIFCERDMDFDFVVDQTLKLSRFLLGKKVHKHKECLNDSKNSESCFKQTNEENEESDIPKRSSNSFNLNFDKYLYDENNEDIKTPPRYACSDTESDNSPSSKI